MQSWVFHRRILVAEIVIRALVVALNIVLAWGLHQVGLDAFISSVVAVGAVFPISYLLSYRAHLH